MRKRKKTPEVPEKVLLITLAEVERWQHTTLSQPALVSIGVFNGLEHAVF